LPSGAGFLTVVLVAVATVFGFIFGFLIKRGRFLALFGVVFGGSRFIAVAAATFFVGLR
jgi:hypothetical protein